MAVTPSPESVKRYPLEWPVGWKRARGRRSADFRMTRETITAEGQRGKRSTSINVATAVERLERQVDLLGAKNPTLSTNVSLSLRGIPRGDENPSDPGVALYFTFKGKATVLACDSFYRVADNIAAIANHIDALRRIERYGVGTIEQALAGYKSLPADTAADWRNVFGLKANATTDDVDREYKRLAREKHPDVTHDDGAAMAHLNRARDYAMQELTQ